MGWTWTYETADGTQLASPPPSATGESFDTQGDAEAWIGETFAQLLAEGVDQVTLLEDGSPSYTMSLHPAE